MKKMICATLLAVSLITAINPIYAMSYEEYCEISAMSTAQQNDYILQQSREMDPAEFELLHKAYRHYAGIEGGLTVLKIAAIGTIAIIATIKIWDKIVVPYGTQLKNKIYGDADDTESSDITDTGQSTNL